MLKPAGTRFREHKTSDFTASGTLKRQLPVLF